MLTAQDIVCIAMLVVMVGWAAWSARRILWRAPRRKKPKRSARSHA